MTKKFEQKILKGSETVVHSCPTDKLLWKFQKTPSYTSLELTSAASINLDALTLFFPRNFLKISGKSWASYWNEKYETKKNHIFYVLIYIYESNPKGTVWNSFEKLMSLVKHLLSKSAKHSWLFSETPVEWSFW